MLMMLSSSRPQDQLCAETESALGDHRAGSIDDGDSDAPIKVARRWTPELNDWPSCLTFFPLNSH